MQVLAAAGDMRTAARVLSTALQGIVTKVSVVF